MTAAAAGERSLLDTLIARLTQQASSVESLRQEFYALPDDGNETGDHQLPTSCGSKPENKKKNRYKDILPYDHSRVTLQSSGGPDSDYVNANYVKGPNGKPTYIACQGPLKHTIYDMWRMIWECGIQAIIMACNEREGERTKCERYWPATLEESFKVDDVFLIRLVSERSNPQEDFVVRRLRVTLLHNYLDPTRSETLLNGGTTRFNESGQQERDVTQYHYIGWPDYGIPASNSHIIQLLSQMRAENPRIDLPIVVHCSAGCGRTGTVMCVDYVSCLIRHNLLTTDVSIKNIILEMRRQRAAVVQSFDQYSMCYRCVVELLTRRLAELSDDSTSQSSRNLVAKPSVSEKLCHNRADVPELKTGRLELTSTSNALDASPNSPFVLVPSTKSRSATGSTSPLPSPLPSCATSLPSTAFVYSPSPKAANSPSPFDRGGIHSSLRSTSDSASSLPHTPTPPKSKSKCPAPLTPNSKTAEDRNNNNRQSDTSSFGSDMAICKTPSRATDSSAPNTPSRVASKMQSILGVGKKSSGCDSASPSPSPSPSVAHANGGDESRATRMCQFVFRGIDISFRKLVGAHPQGSRDSPWTPPHS